jgi:hypothetical protein
MLVNLPPDMVKLGDLLIGALGWKRRRGSVFWIDNAVWRLRLYQGARANQHPGLVTDPRPRLAPGSSQTRGDRVKYQQAFIVRKTDSLNGRSSVFFLALRKYIAEEQIGDFLGQLGSEDLDRLSRTLDGESTGVNEIR